MNELEAAVQRQDDLRAAESRRVDDLRAAETKRIDAIRAADVSATTMQAVVLANQVAQSAETLRVQSSQLTERVALLEKAEYARKGSSGGMRDMWGWIVAGVIGLIAVASFLWTVFKH